MPIYSRRISLLNSHSLLFESEKWGPDFSGSLKFSQLPNTNLYQRNWCPSINRSLENETRWIKFPEKSFIPQITPWELPWPLSSHLSSPDFHIFTWFMMFPILADVNCLRIGYSNRTKSNNPTGKLWVRPAL